MSKNQHEFYCVDSYTTEESIGYLMKGAWLTLLKTIDTEMQPLELTGMQWGPLFLISKGRCDTVASCAQASYSDSGAMTRMLDRLETKGLVNRVRSATDRRVVNLELTLAGQSISQQIPARLVKVLNQHLQGFSEDEFELFKNMLRRFAENGNATESTST